MLNQIEHYEITNACNPPRHHPQGTITCDCCGFTTPDDGDDEFYRWEGSPICSECLEEKIDDMSLCEKAALLGVEQIA